MSFRLIIAAIATGFVLAASFTPASAQSAADMMNGGGGGVLPMKTPSVSNGGPATQQPAALPGAQSNPDRVTPSSGKPSAEMSPNDALFDAINRGDVADARDAINRGAELDARNVLGLTPIDLSVDLSRNDITMLLLSMRGATSTSRAGAPPANAKSAKSASAAHPPAPRAAAAKPTVAEPPVRRQFVSTDPGTPVPQAGFLGFGGMQHP